MMPRADEGAEPLFVAVPRRILELADAGSISRDAAWLYVVLLDYLNRKRVKAGDTTVWPSRKTLAAAMGLRVARAVDRYLAELERARLITIERRKTDKGDNDSNIYVLLCVHPGGSAPQNTTPRPAETGVMPGQGVVPARTPGVVPARTPGVVLHRAHELEEVEPEEVQPSTRPRFPVLAQIGARPEEDSRIITEAQSLAGKPIGNMGGYLAALHRDGKLAAILAALRAPARDRVADDWRRGLRDLPRCPHEVNGGTERHPTTGRLACPTCHRAQHTTAPADLAAYRTAKAG